MVQRVPQGPVKSLPHVVSCILTKTGWISGQKVMVMTIPVVLGRGAEWMWAKMPSICPGDCSVPVSFAVHLGRGTFLHSLVSKKPVNGECAACPAPHVGDVAPRSRAV